jgi:hypothetical protein
LGRLMRWFLVLLSRVHLVSGISSGIRISGWRRSHSGHSNIIAQAERYARHLVSFSRQQTL